MNKKKTEMITPTGTLICQIYITNTHTHTKNMYYLGSCCCKVLHATLLYNCIFYLCNKYETKTNTPLATNIIALLQMITNSQPSFTEIYNGFPRNYLCVSFAIIHPNQSKALC